MERLSGVLPAEPVQNADLCADDEILRLRLACEPAHTARGEPLIRRVAHVARAFGVNHHDGAGMPSTRFRDGPGGNHRMRGAVAGPERIVAPQETGDMSAQMLIGHEKDLLVRREPGHHPFGVAARHADVALGFDFRRGVHVTDGFGAGVFRLQCAQLRAGDHVRHRAAGCRLGDEHRLGRVEDLGRFGHKPHAAEDNHVSLDFRRTTGELQRIAGEVGDVLHLPPRVVVGEDHGVAHFSETRNLFCCLHQKPPHPAASMRLAAKAMSATRLSPPSRSMANAPR